MKHPRKKCTGCDGHPAREHAPYAEWCESCVAEINEFRQRVGASCAECPTPLTCIMLRCCDANRPKGPAVSQLELIA